MRFSRGNLRLPPCVYTIVLMEGEVGTCPTGEATLGIGDVLDVAPVRKLVSEDVAAAYHRHYVSLCRLARLIVDDGSRAEELVQDTFARTYAVRSSINDTEALLAYLRTAVVRACHSELRRRRIERRLGFGVASKPLEGSNAYEVEAAGGPSPTADEISTSIALRRALAALPARQREAVVLHYFADLDQADVAAAMGCSVGTVKSQLFKARDHLASLLSDRVGGGSEKRDR